MGSGGNKGRGEGREGTYVPSLPTLRPPVQCLFPAQIVFTLLPLSDRLEQATKDVFQSTWAQLFEGRLALNPGLSLTRVSFSLVQKPFLR